MGLVGILGMDLWIMDHEIWMSCPGAIEVIPLVTFLGNSKVVIKPRYLPV